MRPAALFSELKRRRVFRVTALYGLVAWGVVQGASAVLPMVEAPAWVGKAVLLLIVAAFPLVVGLAWVYDLTSGGIRRTGTARLSNTDPTPAVGGRALVRPALSDEGMTRPLRVVALPFRLLRPDPEIEFLTFALADAITCSLSGLRSLVVRSTIAAQRFGPEPDFARIANEAGVDAALTGTLLRDGRRLTVRTQLTSTADGTLMWSHVDHGTMADLFELQERVSRRVATSLRPEISPSEQRRAMPDVPGSPRAYEQYLRANQLAYQVGMWEEARRLYVACLGDDPNYAPAWARIGRCLRLLAKYGDADAEAERRLSESEAAFERALALNPDLALAHSLYASLEVDLGRPAAAMVRLLARLHADGDDVDLYIGLVHAARFCGLLGASLAADRAARRIDPLARTSVAHTLFMSVDYAGALERYNAADIGYMDCVVLATLGQKGEALRLLREREARAQPGLLTLPFLTSLRALLEDDHGLAVAITRSVLDRAGDSAATPRFDGEALYYMVRQLAYLGDTARATSELRRVIDAGFTPVTTFERDPWLERLRGSSHFEATLQRAWRIARQAAHDYVEGGGPELLGPLDPLGVASAEP